ncbi:pa domain protein [Ichthyophthirius multifiliis]|uniref:Pa domain protein n=1 Tax=Ichthyophthirius multifiliis TaxID=5932 RepID=G0QMY7_ICHMU|nr:pa domain protein [Ichthyophthirius multifiliis]EGR33420.1 pa domain protein [Ichthyophthirius multifiliis]|eukprot:XP_004037406.1 pa domain protein [Ichthyophthirius multifiliis]
MYIHNLLIIILLTTYQISQVQANLIILGPQEIKKEIQDLDKDKSELIQYSIGNFGFVPYGKRIIGELIVADPYKGCTEIVKPQTDQLDQTNTSIYFLLIERGECSFVTKAYNAQLIGASVVIFVKKKNYLFYKKIKIKVDDNPNENASKVLIGDDGMGEQIQIPSIIIGYKVGKALKKWLENKQNQGKVQLSIEFVEQKFEQTNYKIWISLPSKYANRLIYQTSKIQKKIGENKLFFEPVYQIFSLLEQEQNENCIQKGKFCAKDPDLPTEKGKIPTSSTIATGADIVNEVIRQLCIFQQESSLWWDYWRNFAIQCNKPQLYKECSYQITMTMENVNVEVLEQCVKANSESNSPLLSKQLLLQEQFKIRGWPSLTINNQIYRGNIIPDNIFEALCNSIQKPEGNCLTYTQDFIGKNDFDDIGSGNQRMSIWVILLITFIGLIAVFALLGFFYRKFIKKEMSQEMNQQVNQMVSQYIAFYESRGKNGE